MSRCLACSAEGCGRYSPPCTCGCHGYPDPIARVREVLSVAAPDPIAGMHVDPAGFWQATSTLAAMREQIPEERRAGSAVRMLCSEEDHTLGCTERCVVNSEPVHAVTRTDLQEFIATIARFERALQTIAEIDRFARHGAAHAQVSRAVRIARAALAGEDVE